MVDGRAREFCVAKNAKWRYENSQMMIVGAEEALQHNRWYFSVFFFCLYSYQPDQPDTGGNFIRPTERNPARNDFYFCCCCRVMPFSAKHTHITYTVSQKCYLCFGRIAQRNQKRTQLRETRRGDTARKKKKQIPYKIPFIALYGKNANSQCDTVGMNISEKLSKLYSLFFMLFGYSWMLLCCCLLA